MAANLTPAQFALAVPLIVSVFYSTFQVRAKGDRHLFKRVNDNIDRRIFNLRPHFVPDGDFEDLRVSGKLMNIFWKQVDNSKSLEKKSLRVMQNGLLMTSFLDAFIMLTVVAVVGDGYAYWRAAATGVFQVRTALASGSLALFALICLLLLLPNSQLQHLNLSNEQLDYIEQYHRTEVADDIADVWYRLHQA